MHMNDKFEELMAAIVEAMADGKLTIRETITIIVLLIKLFKKGG